jgi:hypothetical protein
MSQDSSASDVDSGESPLSLSSQLTRLERDVARAFPAGYTDCSPLPMANETRLMQCVRFGYFRHAKGKHNGETVRFCQCLVPGCVNPTIRAERGRTLANHLNTKHPAYYAEFRRICALQQLQPTVPANSIRAIRRTMSSDNVMSSGPVRLADDIDEYSTSMNSFEMNQYYTRQCDDTLP